MRIPLDRESDVPLYQQIKTYLRQGILSGSLARIRACPPAANWRVTWASTASPWKAPTPSWKPRG